MDPLKKWDLFEFAVKMIFVAVLVLWAVSLFALALNKGWFS